MKQLARRHFLKSTTSAAVCGLVGPVSSGFASSGPLAGKIKIAVKYQMIREDGMSVVEKFRMLKEAGFDGTELSVKDEVDVDEIITATRETGLLVHGVVNSSNPDIVSAVQLAGRVGADSVLIVAKEDSKLSYEQNFKHWQKVIKVAVPLAEKNGVRLCMENVRVTFLKTAEEMARFVDSFDSPVVRAYFDTGNTITWTKQSAEHWAQVLGRRIYKIDIKDRGHAEFGDKKLREKGAVGTDGGEVNWVKVREELVRSSFSGWATAEVVGGDRKRLTGIAVWMRDVLKLGDV